VLKEVERIVEVPVEIIKTVEVPVEKIIEKIVEVPVEVIKEVEKIVEVPVEKVVERIVERTVEVPVDRIVERIVEVPVEVIKTVEVPVEKIVERIVEVPVEDPIRVSTLQSIEDQLAPQVDTFDPFKQKGSASFGTAWPENPAKGDLFLKVDSKPNKLYKWNGRKWIEIDRQRINDTLVYDPTYIDYVIDQVRRGLRDYEDLSEIEKNQIVARIKEQNS
jgi:hypothetical protein